MSRASDSSPGSRVSLDMYFSVRFIPRLVSFFSFILYSPATSYPSALSTIPFSRPYTFIPVPSSTSRPVLKYTSVSPFAPIGIRCKVIFRTNDL